MTATLEENLAGLAAANDAIQAELARIVAVLGQARGDYRNALLEVGRMSGEFIRDGLGRGVSAHALRVMLAGAMSRVAGKKVQPGKLIGAYWTVQLLGGGDAGALSYGTIQQFAPFVAHDLKAETWAVARIAAEAGPELFRRAREGRWGRWQAHEAVSAHFPGNRAKFGHRAAAGRYALQGARSEVQRPASPLLIAKESDPKDTAELLVDILRGHGRRKELLAELRRQLTREEKGELTGG